MSKKNGKHRHSFINSILMMFSMYKLVGKVITTLKVDTYQTGRNLLTFSLMLLIGCCFFLSAWFSLMIFLFFYLLSLKLSTLLSLFCVFVLNTILLSCIIYKMMRLKNHLIYPITTRLLSYYAQKN